MAEKKTVEWYVDTRGFVKFIEDTEPYFVTEEVQKFLADKPLEKDEVVNVEFGKDETGDKTVNKVLRNKTSKKEEVKEEVLNETKQEANEVTGTKDLTVHGVSVRKRTIVFKEDTEKWYDLDESLDIKEVKDKFPTKTNVTIKLSGDKIIGIQQRGNIAPETKKESSNSFDNKKEDTVKTEKDAFYRVKELERQVRYLENAKQESIEAQAAVNSANELVGRLFSGEVDGNNAQDGNLIKELIKKLAIHNYSIIQELKSNK